MLSEGRKRDAAANAVLALSFAANAAQSPQSLVSSGKVEAPGVAGMQRLMDPRKKRKDLDLQRVSHSARNRKMKTFKEFVEEAYLFEMRKEDKVAGKAKTPLTVKSSRKSVEPAPEGSGRKWKTTSHMVGNPTVSAGRFKQGAQGGDAYGYKRHAHGGAADWTAAGKSRGVKKVKGEKKPEVGHTTPAQKVANRRANQAYLFGKSR